MAEDSKIQWTDSTFNPWRGCTKVSAGCAHCYAEALSGRNPKTLGVWGPNGTRVVAAEAGWREPVKWNKIATLAQDLAAEAVRKPFPGITVLPYERPRVFCASLADVFEDWKGPMVNAKGERLTVGPHGEWIGISAADQAMLARGELQQTESDWLTMDGVRERLLFLIRDTPELDWLLLTKRPENILDTFCRLDVCDVEATFPNLWLGTTTENQESFDERWPHLRDVPAAVRFVSYEPALGPLDISKAGPLLDWVIAGGESGHGARPFDLSWARALRDQCKAAGVSYFFKQTGQNVVGLSVKGKGGDLDAIPADLRVREFPKAAA